MGDAGSGGQPMIEAVPRSDGLHSHLAGLMLTPLTRTLTARQIARPFEWTFTREKLNELIARIEQHEPQPQLALAA